MTDKHYKDVINLFVADEGYGSFYDPDMGYDLEMLADKEDVDFQSIMDIETETAARLSKSYNLLLSVPSEILFDPEFKAWMEEVENNFTDVQNFRKKLKKFL